MCKDEDGDLIQNTKKCDLEWMEVARRVQSHFPGISFGQDRRQNYLKDALTNTHSY